MNMNIDYFATPIHLPVMDTAQLSLKTIQNAIVNGTKLSLTVKKQVIDNDDNVKILRDSNTGAILPCSNISFIPRGATIVGKRGELIIVQGLIADDSSKLPTNIIRSKAIDTNGEVIMDAQKAPEAVPKAFEPSADTNKGAYIELAVLPGLHIEITCLKADDNERHDIQFSGSPYYKALLEDQDLCLPSEDAQVSESDIEIS